MLELLSKKARESLETQKLTPAELLSEDFLKTPCLTKRDREKLELIREAFVSYEVSQVKGLQITSSQHAGRHLVNLFSDLKHEEVHVLLLDAKNKVIEIKQIFKGSLNSSVAHPREIFKAAIDKQAARIIVTHNHPSGDPEPSDADINFTKRLVKAGEIIGIECLDHIIIGDRYLSLKEAGYM